MRALLQRVTHASVCVNGGEPREIRQGLVILLGIKEGDTEEEAAWLAEKCVNLRIFGDDAGKFNRSALDIGAELLVISQFTLYGDCRRGRRPGFTRAAHPDFSEPMYERFVQMIRDYGLRTETGEFGANMLVNIANDGPVTLMVDSKSG